MDYTRSILPTHPRAEQLSDALLDCIDACQDCATTCVVCADACLAESDPKSLETCIRLNADCAAICTATGEVLARLSASGQDVMATQLEACIAACVACAEECEKHAPTMDHCRICAEACRACETACQEALSSALVGA